MSLLAQLRGVGALVGRNLRIARRRPDLLVQTMAVPVVVVGLASVIFGATDAWPVAVVDRADSPASHRVVAAIEDVSGATGPYFRVVETDPARAGRLVEDGRLHLVVTIPAEFDTSRTLETTTFNINTDAMKNVRLRLSAAANAVDAQADTDVRATIDKAKAQDVTRTAFMGASAVILALLLGAALLSANVYAVETEHRTTKELALSPLGHHVAGVGAALTGWVLTWATAVPTALVALALGTRVDARQVLLAALVVAPASLAAAGVGVWVAARLRVHRAIQPTIILVAIGSYFASGGFVPVPGLPPLARALATWWPPSYVFEWANPVLHGFRDAPSAGALVAVGAAAALGVVLAARAAQRDLRRSHAQGQ
ncbi:ABC transporter permease [Cellulomonas fengjieae]|uniref:ABC transporter permease n=1 Tax=Cellulomonas fengjieae TaxID=2819978 RepID=UPI001AAF4AE0|nr:ABC transporter permease [Cellulomonas fengjieae]MBO3102312.1 ABC transporter permease [Cellulomonas fengjieae]